MRYVKVNCLKSNMTLAKTLYNASCTKMLIAGQPIRAEYIRKIKSLGYPGLYIEDALSKGLEIPDIIPDQLRIDTVKTLKLLCQAQERKIIRSISQYMDEVALLTNQITDEVIEHADLMVNVMDMKVIEDYLFYHSVNTAVISLMIGTSMNLTKEQLRHLGLAAIFHDFGKVGMPRSILTKAHALDKRECEILEQHPIDGFHRLRNHFAKMPAVSIAVLQHHERYNGSGYPGHKRGENINLYSRIIAAANDYDALISKQPRQDAVLPSRAVQFLATYRGTLYDPKVIDTFMHKVAAYPVGMGVELSDGTKGIVVRNFEDANARPLVQILNTNSRIPIYLNLKDDPRGRGVSINGIIDL